MMGGLSAEKEISLKSGHAVADALKKKGHIVVPLEILYETEEEIRRAVIQSAVDVIFIAMHGGFGEDGRLQHILDKLDVPYTGPKARASHIAMDKVASRRLFKKAGLKVPRSRLWKKGRARFWATLFLHYPLVIKPPSQGSSIGISFVHTPKEIPAALDLALKFGDEVLIEEFIKGKEVTVSVLDGRALPVIAIIPKGEFFDYEAKYHKGLTDYVVPASLPQEVTERAQRDAVAAYHALGCRHQSRVDIILSGDQIPYILEVNTIPGMTETSLLPKACRAVGISFEDLCQKLVELAYEGRGFGKK
jgi:D-alanine-D-alanine ligase